jgi:hypothetical protein
MKISKQDILEYMTQLSGEDLRKFEEEYGQNRWVNTYGFPSDMYKWFRGGISKHRGDAWENQYVAACSSLGPKTNGDHDATLDAALIKQYGLKGQTVEIKFFTAMTPDSAKQIESRGWALPWGERALKLKTNSENPTGWEVPKKGTWQQVKPNCAHYGLFSALHGNGAVHYWVPYHLISRRPGKSNVEKGMIPMGIQHRGHEIEGQVDIKSRFHELFFLDVSQDTPFLTDLSVYDLAKYENVTY